MGNLIWTTLRGLIDRLVLSDPPDSTASRLGLTAPDVPPADVPPAGLEPVRTGDVAGFSSCGFCTTTSVNSTFITPTV
jgi:hypothetical protein